MTSNKGPEVCAEGFGMAGVRLPTAARPPLIAHRSLPERRREGAFLLLEMIIAVLIFSLGVIALGRCMSECLDTQAFCGRQGRATLALQNRMVEIQASPIMPDENKKRELTGMFSGMTMIEHRRTLRIKNEDNADLSNLQEMTLTAQWSTPAGQTQSSGLTFVILRGTQ